ncbi:ATP-binding protein [Alteromonas lipotrueiana]|uniref:ATP-binding protein n=1 Tax=Alteromonas lipotrueiana TaxID=2803815 RepID=UPI001C46074C
MKLTPSVNSSALIVLTVCILCVVLAIIIAVGELQLVKKSYREASTAQSINLDEVHQRLQEYLNGYTNDIQFLYQTPPIQGMVASASNLVSNNRNSQNSKNKNVGEPADYQQWRARMQTIFEAFMRNDASYHELSFIRANGEELIHTFRSGLDVSSLSSRQLRQLSDSSFFARIAKLKETAIDITPVEPARLNDIRVHPVIPTIRITLPVYREDGVIFGYLSSSINLTTLLNSLRNLVHEHHDIVLANADHTLFYISSSSGFADTQNAFTATFEQLYKNNGEISDAQGLYQYIDKSAEQYMGTLRPVTVGAGRTAYTLLVWVLIDKTYFEQQLNYQRLTLYSALAVGCFILIVVAIAVLRRAKNRLTLAQTQAEAQVLFENSQNGIVIINKRYTVTNCNRQFAHQCQLAQSKIIGHQLEDVLHGRLEQGALFDLLQFEKNELKHDFIIKWNQPGALTSTYRCLTSFIEVKGSATAIALIFSDVTEELRGRQKIEQTNNQLEAKIAERTYQLGLAHKEAVRASKTKSKFISDISHEMRTPLNGVVGSLSLLSRVIKDEEGSRYVAMAQTSAHALNALINDILDLSKIEAGKLDIETKPFSPQHLIENLVTSMSAKASEKGLQLYLDTSNLNFISYSLDPHRLTQIINNLLSNAIKFTSKGWVAVTVSGEINSCGNARLHISVADTGIGIAEQDQTKLFNSFNQADKTIAAKYGGTGLGLSICKQLCELMGGDISLNSQYKQGTTVSFYVSSDTFEAEPFPPRQQLQGKQVAVFTNSEQEQRILSNMISNAGGKLANYAGIDDLPVENGPFPDAIIIDAHSIEFREFLLHVQSCPKGGLTEHTQIILLQQTTQLDVAHSLTEVTRLMRPLLKSEFFAKVGNQRNADKADSVCENRDTGTPLSESAARAILSGRHVVVVDDNEINLEVAVSMLNAFHTVVVKARNGEEAIAIIKELTEQHQVITAVLMDCNMPGMDGYETTRAIRAGKAGVYVADVPVIAMTANAMRGEKEKCLEAGMSDYISKPLTVSLLIEKLAPWCKPENSTGVNEESAQPDAIITTSEVLFVSQPTLRFDKSGALSRLMDNEVLLKKLVTLFVNGSSEKLIQLQQAVKAQDYEQARQASHALKGQASDIGAVDLQNQLHELESLAKSKEKPISMAHMQAIEHTYKQLIGELQSYLETPDEE